MQSLPSTDQPEDLFAQFQGAPQAGATLREQVALCNAYLKATEAKTADATICRNRFICLNERGVLLYDLGDSEEALASHEQAYAEAHTERDLIEALTFIGNQLTYMGQTDRALDKHREALSRAEKVDDLSGRGRALGGIGRAYMNRGRTEEALIYFDQSLKIFKQLQDIEQQAITWNRLGIAYHELGKLDKAIEAYSEACQLGRQLRRQDIYMDTLGNLGECYLYLFDTTRALSFYEEGLQSIHKLGLQADLQAIDVRRGRGVCLCGIGKIEEGIAEIEAALEIGRTTYDPDLYLQVLSSLAHAHLTYGNTVDASPYLEEQRQLAEKQKARSHLATHYYLAGKYYQLSSNLTSAEQMWQQALFLAHETGQRYLLWQIHAELAQISNPALAAVHNRIAAEVIEQIAYPIRKEKVRQQFLNAAPICAIVKAAQG